MDQDIFLLKSILSTIVTVVINPEKNEVNDWDISIVFASMIMPQVFDVFARAGVHATVISGKDGSIINSKPFFLVTRELGEQRLNLSFSAKIPINGRRGRKITTKVKVDVGDMILFSYQGELLRQFEIKPEFEL
jgi:hypothetical protein